jgi:DNA invertase Pin-like site-specific DNA recombinase
MTMYGYARVSTTGQDLDGQLGRLKDAGCARVYREKVSGARSDRPELRKAIKALQSGDTLMITRLDRLARSTRDLLNVLDEVARAGATFKSLADAWADTTTAHGRLIVTVLGGLAEFERELIRVRTTEGRVRAVAAGVRMGRRPKLSPPQRAHAIELREAGKSLQEIGDVLGVSHMTVWRHTDRSTTTNVAGAR